jgi:murein DD-endopeptidase MepM/ murein hydrolase activator NlpD
VTAKKYSFLLEFMLLTILSSGVIDAQESSDDTSLQSEKIYLDGTLVYRNAVCNKIISIEEFSELSGLAIEEVEVKEKEKEEEEKKEVALPVIQEFWDTTRVNAYRNYQAADMFVLFFDATHFIPPVAHNMYITSRYGHRKRGPHRGIDVDLVTGDNIRSVLSGQVRFAGYSRGHGRTVVVRHSNGLETVYAHLSKYKVKINDFVEAGDLLGEGGATGNARGSHLHFEMRYKGICIHPEYLFKFDGSNEIRASELWVTSSWKNANHHSSYKKSYISVLSSEAEAIAYKEAEPKYHAVQRGDTLYGIAITYNLKLSEICHLNRIKPSSILKVGKKLQVR